jgi:hypothetical protein
MEIDKLLMDSHGWHINSVVVSSGDDDYNFLKKGIEVFNDGRLGVSMKTVEMPKESPLRLRNEICVILNVTSEEGVNKKILVGHHKGDIYIKEI